MRVTILGCGASTGTPGIALGWGACDPANPRNRRRRPSILVENAGTTVLVDTSPDLREQLVDTGTERLDAVLYTHAHADHLHGIDDLRAINRAMEAAIPMYADRATLDEIEARFGYVLGEPGAGDANARFYRPVLVPNEIAPGQSLRIGDIPVTVFDQDHGYVRTLGFRFGDVAYSTDVTALPEESFSALAGVRVWIVDALAEHDHPTHAHVDKALAWIERVNPERAVLTHMSVWLDYGSLKARLPERVEPAYDGLVIEV